MPTANRLTLGITTLAFMTAVAGASAAQDRPPAKAPAAKAQPAKAPPRKAQPAKPRATQQSSKPEAPKVARDERDDAAFGGEESTSGFEPEEPVAVAVDGKWGDEEFDELDTEAAPEQAEAEDRTSTRRPPAAASPAAHPQKRPPAATPITWRPSASLRPDVLDWEEGADVPEGYEPGTRARKGLIIGGAITFGVSWLAAVAYGTHRANEGRRDRWDGDDDVPAEAILYVPLAGPWIALSTLEPNRREAGAFIADGVLQAGGLAMLAAGLFAKETVLVKSESAEVSAAPLVGPDGSGIALSGRF